MKNQEAYFRQLLTGVNLITLIRRQDYEALEKMKTRYGPPYCARALDLAQHTDPKEWPIASV